MRNSGFRHWSWADFSALHMAKGEDRTLRIPGRPHVDLQARDGGRVLELRIASESAGKPPRELASFPRIAVASGRGESGAFVSLSCSSPTLHPEFFHMAILIADRVQIEQQDPFEAMSAGLSALRALSTRERLFSRSEEIGLVGELWTLARLLRSRGADAATSWLGPARREHDFRLENGDVEVKTTARVRRIHLVHGLDQLTPLPDRQLYVLSIHISPAGEAGGFSLAGLRADIRRSLRSDSRHLGEFEKKMGAFPVEAGEWDNFSEEWVLRSPARLVPSAQCPSLSSAKFKDILPPDHAVRIDDVAYSVDFEGLGIEDGDEAFLAILPAKADQGGEGPCR